MIYIIAKFDLVDQKKLLSILLKVRFMLFSTDWIKNIKILVRVDQYSLKLKNTIDHEVIIASYHN